VRSRNDGGRMTREVFQASPPSGGGKVYIAAHSRGAKSAAGDAPACARKRCSRCAR
jgi:hypothetical protein